MADRGSELSGHGGRTDSRQAETAPARGGAPETVRALTFISVMFFVVVWIVGFLLVQHDLAARAHPAGARLDLICLVFFGGLLLAICAGALTGNLLRRVLWRIRTRRGK